jgi:glucose-6-phosphate isomerase
VTEFSIDPGDLAPALDTVFSQLDRDGVADKLWTRQSDLWSSDPAVRRSIANRLGWLDAVEFATASLSRVRSFVDRVHAQQFTDVVLFGMGGSSLAPEVFRSLFGRAGETRRFTMLDSTDPDSVHEALSRSASSLFILASKSGTTIEPNAMAAAARVRVESAGVKDWASRFVAITDAKTPLHTRAVNEGFFDVFVNPSDVGGRYSALTLFGIVPAALIGAPLDVLLEKARSMADACRTRDARTNPGLALGALMGAAANEGRDKLTLLLPEQLAPLALWIEQLVAESTGKHGKGIVPIAGETEAAATADDRVVVRVRLDGDPGNDSIYAALKAAGVPTITIEMSGLDALGAEFIRWEIATAVAGRLLEINPFDEPNVQQAKDATRALLDAYATHRELPRQPSDLRVDGIEITFSTAARKTAAAAGLGAFLDDIGHTITSVCLPTCRPTTADLLGP